MKYKIGDTVYVRYTRGYMKGVVTAVIVPDTYKVNIQGEVVTCSKASIEGHKFKPRPSMPKGQ